MRVRTALAGAHGILTTTAYERAKYLADRRDPRERHHRRKRSPEAMSVLASVMGVTQEVCRQFRDPCMKLTPHSYRRSTTADSCKRSMIVVYFTNG